MGKMRVMGSRPKLRQLLPDVPFEIKGGDTTVAWPEQTTEAQAKDAFDKLIEANYNAYEVSGGSGTQIKEFDPDAEIILAPPLAGG